MSKNVKNTIIQYSKGNKHLKMKCNEPAVINLNSAYSEIQNELVRHFQHHSNFHFVFTVLFTFEVIVFCLNVNHG